MALIVDELTAVRDAYGDERRTVIEDAVGDIGIEDMIAPEDMVVTASHSGYVKRNPISLYKAQKRGGRGITGAGTTDEDFVAQLFVASTHDHILMFTNKGRAYAKRVYEIPQGGRASRGKALVNFLELKEGEKVVEMLPVREFSDGAYVMMATRKGKVKKTSLNAYANIRSSGIIAALIGDDDDLVDVRITVGTFDVMLGTRNGMATRFREEQVRPMGRASGGVRGIRLKEGDEVIGMAVLRPDSAETLITVCERGYGKRTALADYPIKNRGAQGVITIKATERNGKVVGMRIVSDDDDLMIITDRGKLIRMPVHGIPTIGRNTQGVRLIRLDDEAGEKVVAVERLAEKAEEGESGVEVAAPVEAPTGELEFEAEEEGGEEEPDEEPEPENGDGEGDGEEK